MNIEKLRFPDGLTVRDLKALIADWPEETEDGSLTEVWIGQPGSTSRQAFEAWPLNMRRTEEGNVYADLLLDGGT